MKHPKELIGHLAGGRVLDVATGSGGFIHFLVEGLKGYREIIGIDQNERGAISFVEAFKDTPNIHFEQMDARHIDYPDSSFDTVCIANSLHHFDDPRMVVDQMLRVLRPGGDFILAEMYRDGQTETQMMHVHLHHWWAAVDRLSGVVHNETYQRGEIVSLLNGLGLSSLRLYDLSDTEDDPRQPGNLSELEAAIARYLQRAEGHLDLQSRGAELRQRLQQIGFHSASSLLAVGMKPG